MPNVCSGYGNCVSKDNCSCLSGYSGLTCSVTSCYGVNATDPTVCSSQGSCISKDNCTCNSGWTGISCSIPSCYGINATNSNICSGNGNCLSLNNCTCNQGYSGTNCQFPMCYGINSTNSTNSIVCSGKGTCVSKDNCSCVNGYSGLTCSVTSCYGVNATDPTVCSSQGICQSLNNCTCNYGYSGQNCSLKQISCFGKLYIDPTVCSGQGLCSQQDTCVCNPNFIGYECQFKPTATTCFGKSNLDPNVCNGTGVCISNDVCVCNPTNSFGNECQNRYFYWNSQITNGSWSTVSNWLLKMNQNFIPTNSLPSMNDSIFFQFQGTFTIFMDIQNFVSNSKVIIGSDDGQTFYKLILLYNITLNELILNKGSTISEIKGIQFNLYGNCTLNGNLELTSGSITTFNSSVVTVNTIHIVGDSKFIINNGDLIFNTMIIDGELQINNGNGTMSGLIINNALVTFNNTKVTVNTLLEIQNNNQLFFIETQWIGNVNITNEMFIGIQTYTVSIFPPTFTIINKNEIDISGGGKIIISEFVKYPYSTFSLKNSYMIFNNPLNIDQGSFFASGTIESPLINITSNTGTFELYHETLNITGSLILAYESTMIIELNENIKYNDQLIVNENITMNGLFYFRLAPGYNCEVGDLFKFLKYKMAFFSQQIRSILIGAPYRTAYFSIEGNNTILNTSTTSNNDILQSPQSSTISTNSLKSSSLYIDLSIGNLAYADQYKCNYFGDRRMMEVVYFKQNKRVVITLTVPANYQGWTGYGFNSNTSVLGGKYVASSNQIAYKIINHTIPMNINNQLGFLDYGSFRSLSLFSIGQEYDSISMFLSELELENQKYILFVDNTLNLINNTSTHWDNTFYEFYILNQTNLVPCTNFLAPTLAETRSPISIGCLLFLYLLSFIICLIVYKSQPLYSRGFAPYTTLLLLILQLSLETRNYGLIPIEQRTLCLYQAYFLFPLQQLIFVLIIFYIIKYFSIIRINTMKNSIKITIKDGEKITNYSWIIRTLKLLTKWWLILILMILYYFISVSIFTIIYGLSPLMICDYQTLTNLRILHTSMMFIIFFVLLILIFSDVILNIRYIFKC